MIRYMIYLPLQLYFLVLSGWQSLLNGIKKQLKLLLLEGFLEHGCFIYI